MIATKTRYITWFVNLLIRRHVVEPKDFSFFGHLLMCLLFGVCSDAFPAPPQLYHQGAQESPVRGQPDDLLLLAGYGLAADDLIVYRLISDTTKKVAISNRLPSGSSLNFGLAPVVSAEDAPYSLTVKLPKIMRANQAYALWVRTPGGELSEPVKINDARPLWITPSYLYSSQTTGGLPRELKIVGRNLDAGFGQTTLVRLIGPQQVTAAALVDARGSAAMNQYVARVSIPAHMTTGSYRIQVNRDGISWVDLANQLLKILPDPAPPANFPIDDPRFGNCHPDDGLDDSECIIRAIAAASDAGGGIVSFGPGTWDLIGSDRFRSSEADGTVVPLHVQLRGAGSTKTRLVRHAESNARSFTPAFTLAGDNSVTGIHFQDLQKYGPDDQIEPYLQLGRNWQRAAPDQGEANTTISDIVISQNIFDRPQVAIGAGGLPISRLFITHNTFGAYHSALELTGDQFNTAHEYRIDDSVINDNVFMPGSELDVKRKSGTLASELGAGKRLDFSGNVADGSAEDYLYGPDDAKGWRAAFFWTLNGNVEETLVSQNSASCTGDKVGDGEAIALDDNLNTFGFRDLPAVSGATASSVSISVPLVSRQHNRNVPIESYYVGQWVQVANGPGLGQVRKISAYWTDPATRRTTIRVIPDWDVVPVSGKSYISVGREYWQVYVLDNHVDNRQPLCQKSNRGRRAAGVIEIWAGSADSVLAGNDQHDSDGIFVQQNYAFIHGNFDSVEQPCEDCTGASFFNYFLDIRDNTIDGEYDWSNDCSSSGITIGIAAAPGSAIPPPTVGFGVSISHNTVQRADAQSGGAISQVNTWGSGPAPHRWPLSDSLLIQHNAIIDIDGPRAIAICGKSRPRMGIAFPDSAIAWHTVLYANSCKNVSTPIGGSGVETVNVCPSSVSDSCECSPAGK